MTSLKIAHVIPSISTRTGGPAFAVASLCSELSRLDQDVTLLTTDLGAAASAKFQPRLDQTEDMPPIAEPVTVIISPVKHFSRWAYSPDLTGKLSSGNLKPDVIHIHSVNLHPQCAAWREARRRSVPFIVTPHGALDPYFRARNRFQKTINNRLWQNRMLDEASAIHLTTRDERELIADMRISAPRVVVPIGIDIDRFSGEIGDPSIFEETAGLKAERWIVNHGRVAAKKGLDILISAFAIVATDRPGTKLAIIGPDDEGLTTRLMTHAKSLGIDNSVVFLSPLSGTDLTSAIRAADVWVLPSHSENFGMAVAEAMAAARPVVTSPHVNIAPEAAAASALVMVDNQPERVAEAISALLGDQDRRNQLGRRAREYVKRFDWSELGPQYIAMYNDAIEYHRRRGPYKRRLW